MKKQLIIILLVFIITILAIIFMRSLSTDAAPQDKARPVPNITYSVIQKETVDFTIESQGTVLSKQYGPVSSEVSGVVTDKSSHFLNGERVAKGEILITIDPTDYKVAVARARSSLYAAQLELEDKNARYEKDSLSIKQAQAAYDAAQAAYEKAQSDLEKTKIKAPYNGIVVEKNAEIGQMISASSQVARLVGTDVSQVRLPIAAEDIHLVNAQPFSGGKLTNPVTLTAHIGGKQVQRTVTSSRIEANMDLDTRIFHLVAEIENPYDEPALPSGVFVTANIAAEPVSNAVSIPMHTVHDNNKVYVVEDNAMYEREVTVHHKKNNQVIVSAGLENGDKLVQSRIELMFDGMKVNAVVQE